MNQTTPRCLQCGENPRMIIGYSDCVVNYHPLCNECHLVLWEKSKRESRRPGSEGLPQEGPKKEQDFLLRLVCESRFIALGALISSVLQFPAVFLKGPFSAVVVHSIVIGIMVPCAAAGFWMNRLNRRKP